MIDKKNYLKWEKFGRVKIFVKFQIKWSTYSLTKFQIRNEQAAFDPSKGKSRVKAEILVDNET